LAFVLRSPIQLPDVPFRLFAASARDEFRKPLIGMWTKLEALYREENVTIGA
jgi:bifunctional polynucleotide phosphatase/kinase